jgi:hypothetical protein
VNWSRHQSEHAVVFGWDHLTVFIVFLVNGSGLSSSID